MKRRTLFYGRLFLILIAIVLQIFLVFFMMNKLSQSIFVSTFFQILSYIIIVYLIGKQGNTSIKLAWAILILTFPLFGGILYLLIGGKQVNRRLRIANLKHYSDIEKHLKQDPVVLNKLSADAKVFNYGINTSNFPVYDNCELMYLKSGEEKLERLLEELEKAKHFIFLEYFIIKDGEMWQKILAVLKQKVQENVEVKIIYDDFGTQLKDYDLELKKYGIEALRFSPLRPALIIQMNNRDHRKICVIDNNVAFCGGINIGDEYINKESPYGYWKDSSLMIKGAAVYSFTIMFLQVYKYMVGEDSYVDYEKYNLKAQKYDNDGFIQPYFDSPTDGEAMGLNMHLNIINNAKKYIYIHTPYLIIDEQVQNALCIAAKSGVDVRITTPHIPDKKYVFEITQHNYLPLLNAGVKIYEFIPGFMHSKAIVSDDIAICGTINMDFRSYFHHFECGVLLKDDKVIKQMYQDQVNCLALSRQIMIEDCLNVSLFRKVYRALLNLFASLL